MQMRDPLQSRSRSRLLRHIALSLTFSIALVCAHAAERFPRPARELSADEANKEIERLQAVQRQLLQQVRHEIALLGNLPPEAANEAKALRARRARLSELKGILAEVERRINEDPTSRTRYFTSDTKDPDVLSYHDKLRDRIEKEGMNNFPKAGTRSIYGEVTLVLTVLDTGELESVDVFKSTSDELSRHSTQILNKLAPFDPFPVSLSQKANRLVIPTKFKYARE